MMILSLKQVQRLVVQIRDEGLCASFRSVFDGDVVEMLVQSPRGRAIGDPLPDYRDVSIVTRPDSEDRVVAAHTELGALFLQMAEAGEL